MANDTAGLFATVVSAATGAATITNQFQNAFIDAVYWDYSPEVRREPGQAITITIPTVDEADTVDAAGGPYTPTDTKHNAATITLNKDFTNSFLIRNWDQVRTGTNLRDKYFAPRLQSLVRKVNRTIAQAVTVANFNSYALISGLGADVFGRGDLAGAWKNLAGAGVPTDDAANMSFVTNHVAYGNMLGDPNFAQESIVGVDASRAAFQQARLLNMLGARPYYDQHFAVFNAGKQPGVLMHRYAISGVSVTPISDAPNRTIIFPKPGLPVLVEFEYLTKERGYLIGMTCQWGLAVTRPDYASLVETA